MLDENTPDVQPGEADNLAQQPTGSTYNMATNPRKSSQRPDFDPKLLASYKPMTLDQLERLPPAQWRIEGWLPEDVLAVLYGAPEAGKTFLALDWALCMATGTPWQDCQVAQGKVLYVVTETPQGLTKRVNAWLAENGEHLRPLVEKNFRVFPRPVNLADAWDRKHFMRAQYEFQPNLFVIDTLNKCFGSGDENSTKDMTAFVTGCNELRVWFPGATVLVLHHSGRAEDRGARGSTVLLADAAAEFHLSQRGKSEKRVLENTKQRDAAKPDPLHLQLVAVGESCVIRAATGAVSVGKAKAKPKPEDKALAVLARLGPGGATEREWREATGASRTTFDRHRDLLLGAERGDAGQGREALRSADCGRGGSSSCTAVRPRRKAISHQKTRRSTSSPPGGGGCTSSAYRRAARCAC
jgi:hypothetical protein